MKLFIIIATALIFLSCDKRQEKTFTIEVTNQFGNKDTITAIGYSVDLSFQKPGILEAWDHNSSYNVIAANVFTFKILETK